MGEPNIRTGRQLVDQIIFSSCIHGANLFFPYVRGVTALLAPNKLLQMLIRNYKFFLWLISPIQVTFFMKSKSAFL